MGRRANAESDKMQCGVNLDGTGIAAIDGSFGFLRHMIELLARHALMDVTLRSLCEMEIEAVARESGMVLGEALCAAVGKKEGIMRYAHQSVPLDEAAATVLLDVGGRAQFVWRDAWCTGEQNEIARQCESFLAELVLCSGFTLHVLVEHGKNTHHILECVFKALGLCLREAVRIDQRILGVLSTKGTLENGV